VFELSHRHVRKLETILCWTGTRQVSLLVYPLSVLDGMPHVDGKCYVSRSKKSMIMCYVGVRPEGPMRVQVGTRRVPLVWFCTGLGLHESELLCPVDFLRLFYVNIGLPICAPLSPVCNFLGDSPGRVLYLSITETRLSLKAVLC